MIDEYGAPPQSSVTAFVKDCPYPVEPFAKAKESTARRAERADKLPGARFGLTWGFITTVA
eukprot:12296529-Prorocentrum_lima.AAC.1